ncbi:MAG: gamma-glutamyl-gamma-aminobutyrate hydrolase family protein [Burkholderiaceae bacterium]
MPTEPCRRLALSMRVVQTREYVEARDCIAQDWSRLLAAVLPEAAWLAMPNDPDRVVPLMKAWAIDGLILTGGNDIGEHAEKDASDRAMLDYALRRGLPVLGVCRGLQVMQTSAGGALVPLSDRSHVAVEHEIECLPHSLLNPGGKPVRLSVNSFHGFVIAPGGLAPGLEPMARAADGSIEAARISGAQAVGVMWHPERAPVPGETDRRLIRTLFGWPNP